MRKLRPREPWGPSAARGSLWDFRELPLPLCPVESLDVITPVLTTGQAKKRPNSLKLLIFLTFTRELRSQGKPQPLKKAECGKYGDSHRRLSGAEAAGP